jgi:hypothetical protein
MIRKFKDQLGKDNWAWLFTPDPSYERFQQVCRAKSVDLNLVKEVGDWLRFLTGLKSVRDSAETREQIVEGLSRLT